MSYIIIIQGNEHMSDTESLRDSQRIVEWITQEFLNVGRIIECEVLDEVTIALSISDNDIERYVMVNDTSPLDDFTEYHTSTTIVFNGDSIDMPVALRLKWHIDHFSK